MDDTENKTAVIPSAVPSDAEKEAWASLPRDEQLRRLQLALADPDCDVLTPDTVDGILALARARWKTAGNG